MGEAKPHGVTGGPSDTAVGNFGTAFLARTSLAIVLVQDNLNIHSKASLYEAFPAVIISRGWVRGDELCPVSRTPT